MNNEFNLEKALAGKAVVHIDGTNVVKIGDYGECLVVLYEGRKTPVVYEKELVSKYLRMAEEEIYIRLYSDEINNGHTRGQKILYKEHPDKKDFRAFKLVEVHGKD